MDLVKLGAQLFLQKAGGSSGLDISTVMSALKGLLPTNGDELDLGSIIGQMNGGGLASMAASWLGNGGNDAISPTQILSMLGEGKISSFASQLGMGEKEATDGLAGMLPELIDKQSSGGDLLKSAGASILGKLF